MGSDASPPRCGSCVVRYLSLQKDWKHLAYASYGLCAILALWLFTRVWKKAPVPPASKKPVANAVKGLFPFTTEDGQLFAQLGRERELQTLVGRAQDAQVGVNVVRGESGAGKTSLLRAGLDYTLKDMCLYWEAVPTNAPEALLHAFQSRYSEIESLNLLPDRCPARCVLILDQCEQLNPRQSEHGPVFELLKRIAKAPAPHKLTAVVAFRREFVSDWLDFEDASGFRSDQMAINLLAPQRAKDVLITLASEAGFSLDNKLVDDFVQNISRPGGILPVDIAIGILSLDNFVQRHVNAHVSVKEYQLAGGAEGLLRLFVEQKVDETPEAIRAPMLKGIVLTLVDLLKIQRVAEGASASAIAARAEIPEAVLRPWLERWAQPRVRLLEKTGLDSYRLPHEHLVGVLRQLTGTVIASLDRLKLSFEDGFARWVATRNRRALLSGKELREVARNKAQFLRGENTVRKAEYFALSQRHQRISHLVILFAFIGLSVVGWFGATESRETPARFRKDDSSVGIFRRNCLRSSAASHHLI